MNASKRWIVVGVAGLLVALAGCGGGSSSVTPSNRAAAAPTDATKTAFCATIAQVNHRTSPTQLADTMRSTGTPSDIDSSARHGFEVFVDHLASLPDKPQSSDVQQMVRSVSTSDKADLTAFLVYWMRTCRGGQ